MSTLNTTPSLGVLPSPLCLVPGLRFLPDLTIIEFMHGPSYLNLQLHLFSLLLTRFSWLSALLGLHLRSFHHVEGIAYIVSMLLEIEGFEFNRARSSVKLSIVLAENDQGSPPSLQFKGHGTSIICGPRKKCSSEYTCRGNSGWIWDRFCRSFGFAHILKTARTEKKTPGKFSTSAKIKFSATILFYFKFHHEISLHEISRHLLVFRAKYGSAPITRTN